MIRRPKYNGNYVPLYSPFELKRAIKLVLEKRLNRYIRGLKPKSTYTKRHKKYYENNRDRILTNHFEKRNSINLIKVPLSESDGFASVP